MTDTPSAPPENRRLRPRGRIARGRPRPSGMAVATDGSRTLQDFHPFNTIRGATRPELEAVADRAALRFERQYAIMLANGNHRAANILRYACEQWIDSRNPVPMRQLLLLKRFPVTIRQFMEDTDFMAAPSLGLSVWPKLVDQLVEMNPDVWVGESPIEQSLLGGATGTGKTFLADKTSSFQLYLLTCFDAPQAVFSLARNITIMMLFMSVSQTVTKRVIYEPFRRDFLGMPYSRRFVEYDRNKESTLVLRNGIEVAPVLATVQSMVGQAVVGGIIDEVNFMARVENSKVITGGRGSGGLYDQAEEVYHNLERRRKSRFLTRGFSIGSLCVISSTRYKGDFLDRRIDQVREGNLPGVAVFRRKRYEVVPHEGRYCGETFRLLVGSESYPTRVLTDADVEGQDYPASARIENVPVEHKSEFINDPENALRDIIGVATDTIAPFIKRRHKIMDMVDRGVQRNLRPWTTQDVWDLQSDGFPIWDQAALPTSEAMRMKPHFVHIDLSVSKDTCGIGVIRLDGFTNAVDEENPDVVSVMPRSTVVAALGIKPSGNEQVDIADVRKFVLRLATIHRINIVNVSFDGFQSVESRQVLIKSGIQTRLISMDRTTEPHKSFRSALYQDRVDAAPPSDTLWRELSQLEYYADKDKVDHPPRGTKDVSDAVVGAHENMMLSGVVRTGMGTLDVSDETGHGATYARSHDPRALRILNRKRGPR
jgi:hypothetical protein